MRLTKRDEETIFLILKIYYKYSMVGGQLHIVLDDNNVSNHNIFACMEDIVEIPDRMERITYLLCASNMLRLSEKKRLHLIEFSDRIMSAIDSKQFSQYTAEVIENGWEKKVKDLLND